MLEVVKPGLLSSVQDLGRTGWRHLGVGSAGAFDVDALRIGNELVGNPPGAAAIEFTLLGPVLRARRDLLVALAGPDFEARVDGAPLPMRRPVAVRHGAVLAIGRAHAGARGYVAVAGGIDVPPVLGSRSTDLRSRIGGLEGRALRAGDRLRVGVPGAVAQAVLERLLARGAGHVMAKWWVAAIDDLRGEIAHLHVLDGSDAPLLDRHSIRTATHAVWQAAPMSDRMGVRFDGPRLQTVAQTESISAAVVPGTVQLTPDGRLIVLGVDAQTAGGYPRIGHVIRVDLGRLAQLKPGDRVRPVRVSEDAADVIRIARDREIARMREAIADRLHATARGRD